MTKRGDLGKTFFVYQDASWNVIGTTPPGGDLAEEYTDTHHGRVLVERHTVFGVDGWNLCGVDASSTAQGRS